MITIGHWILLPSDILFLLFICIVLFFLIHYRRDQRYLVVCRYLLAKPIVVISLIIFLVYSLIAIIDSLHIKEHGQIRSLLDKSMGRVSHFYEKTYSKPLALRSAVKSIVQLSGQSQQVYLPLLYPTGTKSPGYLVLIGSVRGVLIIMSLALIIFLLLKNDAIKSIVTFWSQKPFAWRTIGVTFIACVILLSILASVFPHYHLLGTDKIGQDVFYQSVKSIRTAFIIGFLTSFILLPVAICLGIIAGYFGRRIDDMIQYLYTVISSVPSVLLIAASFLSLQLMMHRYEYFFRSGVERADFKLLLLCFVLALTSWTSLCRLIRAETLKLREMDYILAARTMQSSTYAILFKHILPNLMHIVIIATAIDFSGLVLAEAVLSYVGIGVDPSSFSWGLMINAARLELAREPAVWWPLLSAFFMMFCLVFSANIIADALRDALDPRVNH